MITIPTGIKIGSHVASMLSQTKDQLYASTLIPLLYDIFTAIISN